MKLLTASLKVSCAGVLLSLVSVVLWGWITREFGAQARWSEELARLLLVWLSLLGGALAYAEGAHLGIDLITARLHPLAARWAAILLHITVAAFAGIVMAWGGTLLCIERWQSGQVLAALQVSRVWSYLAVPVSGAAITFIAMAFLTSTWRTKPQ